MTTTPAQPFPYVKTGAYQILTLDATYRINTNLQLSAGAKNLSDDYYELAWRLPQPGRTFYVKTKASF